jgi:hypothetical protein
MGWSDSARKAAALKRKYGAHTPKSFAKHHMGKFGNSGRDTVRSLAFDHAKKHGASTNDAMEWASLASESAVAHKAAQTKAKAKTGHVKFDTSNDSHLDHWWGGKSDLPDVSKFLHKPSGMTPKEHAGLAKSIAAFAQSVDMQDTGGEITLSEFSDAKSHEEMVKLANDYAKANLSENMAFDLTHIFHVLRVPIPKELHYEAKDRGYPVKPKNPYKSKAN